jgi:hypothetical protein
VKLFNVKTKTHNFSRLSQFDIILAVIKKYFGIIFFVFVCLTAFLVGPYQIYRSPLLVYLHSGGLVQKIILFRSLTGWLVFGLIIFQLLIGVFIEYWTNIFGKKFVNIHRVVSVFVVLLVIVHPLSFVLINYMVKGAIDPFYVFTDICVLCKNIYETTYTFGRIAFWLIVLIILFKMFTQKKYSKNIFILKILVVVFIVLHIFLY